MTAVRLARIARTAAHVPPGQAAHWAKLRARRLALRTFPAAGEWMLAAAATPGARRDRGWPAGFRPLDARLTETWPAAAELGAGKITLLGLSRELDGPPGWGHQDAPLLWRYHLHYWDWAWGLAADPAAGRGVFRRLWESWSAATVAGQGDAWRPYPAALRAWSWCGLYEPLAAGTDLAPRLAAALATHAAFLRRELEFDVAGNHLIKGLKALVGLAVFTRDDSALRWALTRLARQAARQVLPDGGHHERSPAYHCQVLADLADVAALVAAAGVVPPAEITSATGRMRRWLGTVAGPAGEVPMLGDGYPVPAELVRLLRPVPPRGQALAILPSSGLARLVSGGWHVLADCGGAARRGLAAHAHAGTLGCVASLDGVPLLVDTGTSTYEPGPARAYERSTAAHNTAEVDGADSTEVWGGFRVGRRARARWLPAFTRERAVVCAAAHDGYRHLPGHPIHRRMWSLADGELAVTDEISGGGRHTVAVHWHLAPGTGLRLDGGSATAETGAGGVRVRIEADRPVRLSAEVRPVAVGFGLRADAPVLVCRAEGPLPVRIRTVWARAGDSGEAV